MFGHQLTYHMSADELQPELWDAEKIFSCYCDGNDNTGLYEGNIRDTVGGLTCRDYYCPRGDNPLMRKYLDGT